jgi:hypothetical protein
MDDEWLKRIQQVQQNNNLSKERKQRLIERYERLSKTEQRAKKNPEDLAAATEILKEGSINLPLYVLKHERLGNTKKGTPMYNVAVVSILPFGNFDTETITTLDRGYALRFKVKNPCYPDPGEKSHIYPKIYCDSAIHCLSFSGKSLSENTWCLVKGFSIRATRKTNGSGVWISYSFSEADPWLQAPTSLQMADILDKVYGSYHPTVLPLNKKLFPNEAELDSLTATRQKPKTKPASGIADLSNGASSSSSASSSSDTAAKEEEKEKYSQIFDRCTRHFIWTRYSEDPMGQYLTGTRRFYASLSHATKSIPDIAEMEDSDVVSVTQPISWRPGVILKKRNGDEMYRAEGTQQRTLINFKDDSVSDLFLNYVLWDRALCGALGIYNRRYSSIVEHMLLRGNLSIRGKIEIYGTKQMSINNKRCTSKGGVQGSGYSISVTEAYFKMLQFLRLNAIEVTADYAIDAIRDYVEQYKAQNYKMPKSTAVEQAIFPITSDEYAAFKDNKFDSQYSNWIINCFENRGVWKKESGSKFDEQYRFYSVNCVDIGKIVPGGSEQMDSYFAEVMEFFYTKNISDDQAVQCEKELESHILGISDALRKYKSSARDFLEVIFAVNKSFTQYHGIEEYPVSFPDTFQKEQIVGTGHHATSSSSSTSGATLSPSTSDGANTSSKPQEEEELFVPLDEDDEDEYDVDKVEDVDDDNLAVDTKDDILVCEDTPEIPASPPPSQRRGYKLSPLPTEEEEELLFVDAYEDEPPKKSSSRSPLSPSSKFGFSRKDPHVGKPTTKDNSQKSSILKINTVESSVPKNKTQQTKRRRSESTKSTTTSNTKKQPRTSKRSSRTRADSEILI